MRIVGDYLRRVPEELIVAVQNDVVPHIREASIYALDVHERDVEHSSRLAIGVCLWGNLFERLKMHLDRSVWYVNDRNNDIRISHRHISPEITFRLHRCDPETRMPTCGKAAKEEACRKFKYGAIYLCLNEEIGNLVCSQGSIYIAYDFDPALGLGSITLEMLSGESNRELKALSLASLYEEGAGLVAIDKRPVPEIHEAPSLDRGPVGDVKSGLRKKRDKIKTMVRRPEPEAHDVAALDRESVADIKVEDQENE